MSERTVENNTSGVGELFRVERMRQKLSLDDIASDICVRRCFLESIETDEFSNLPKQTFAVGFARAYAKALGLDVKAITAQFKTEYIAACNEEDLSAERGESVSEALIAHKDQQNKFQPVSVGVQKSKLPSWLSPIAGLVGATASWMFISAQMTGGAWYASNTPEASDLEVQQLAAIQARYIEKDDRNILAVPQDNNVAGYAVSEDTATRGSLFFSAANAEVQDEAPVDVNTITLRANEDSWLQLSYEDGSALWSGVLRAGQDYTPRLIEDVFLTTSNAGGVFLVSGQQTLGPLGDRGEIITDLALNNAMLSETNLSEASQAQ